MWVGFWHSFVRDDNLQGPLLDASGFLKKGESEYAGTLGLQKGLPDSLTALDDDSFASLDLNVFDHPWRVKSHLQCPDALFSADSKTGKGQAWVDLLGVRDRKAHRIC